MRQDEILNAYLDNPNAAAVARLLKTNERQCEASREAVCGRARGAPAGTVRTSAGTGRCEMARSEAAWPTPCSDLALQRLNQLSESSNQSIAIRAVRIKPELALRRPPTNLSMGTGITSALEGLQQDLVREDHWSRPGISRWTRGRSMTTVDLTRPSGRSNCSHASQPYEPTAGPSTTPSRLRHFSISESAIDGPGEGTGHNRLRACGLVRGHLRPAST